jgi:hypothetical protein
VPNKENILPAKQPIHQRHKSASNLRSMATSGTLNAPPKRTAFGDLSNTARTLVAEPAGKIAVKTRVKQATAIVKTHDIRLEDKENEPVARTEKWSRATTASRTASDISKHPVGVSHSSAGSNQTGNPVLRANILGQKRTATSLANPPLRSGVSKKGTAVYQDRKEQKAGDLPETALPTDDLAALMAKPAKNPRHYRSQPVLRNEQQTLLHTQSKFAVRMDDTIDSEDEDDMDDGATEATYEDAVERLSQEAEYAAYQLVSNEQPGPVGIERALGLPSKSDSPDLNKTLPAHPVTSEPEEYWDDEEEEQELYEEQGYVTAHSFRSLGDNTTGGLTTLLAPNVTANVRRELEMAEEWVLANLTEEEWEEDKWDVSMVAEYGEEIFAYMRDLEVGTQSPCQAPPPPCSIVDIFCRPVCSPTHTTWTCRPRFSGQCELSSWTGWYKFTTGSAFFRKLSS